MLSNPNWASFRFYFPQDWLLPNTRSKIDKQLKYNDLPYTTAIDYLNSTIVNSKIPGMSDPGTAKQVHGKGDTRTFASGLKTSTLLEKTITLNFKVKASYFNWVIMYLQQIEYLERKAIDSKPFLPNVYLQIMDDEDNIIIELIYKDIQFRKISDLDFDKQNNGITSRQFTIDLAFNDFEINFLFDKVQSHRKSSDTEYNY